MPWFKVDDGFHGHPKVVGLSPSAVGVWLLTGTWSAQYLTDGAVPRGIMTRLGGTDADAHELIAAGMWESRADGFQFHEWAVYQPSKEEVEAERAAARERMKAVRAKRKGTSKGSEEVRANFEGTSEEVRSTPTQPSPAQPEPSKEGSSSPRKRGTTKGERIPEPFVVTGEMRAAITAECEGLDVDWQTRRFVDYWRAQPGQRGVKSDWVATWRNWMRRAHEEAGKRRLTPTERAQKTVAAGRNVGGHQITTLDPKEIAS